MGAKIECHIESDSNQLQSSRMRCGVVYGVMCTHHGNVVTVSLSEPGIEYTTTHDSHRRRKRGLRKEEVDVWRRVLVSWSHDQAGSAVAGRCAIKRLSPVSSVWL